MDHNDGHYHNHPGNGFLMGVIVGGVATLLVTTKKGREIIKDLTAKGLDKFSEIQKNLDDIVDFEEVGGQDYVDPQLRNIKPIDEKRQKLLADNSEIKVDKLSNSPVSARKEDKTSARRLFKSAKKS